MRYIGSKQQLLPFVEENWRRYVGTKPCCVGDLFCGTAAVSRLFKRLGNKVVATDNLRLGYVLAQAALNFDHDQAFRRLLETQAVPGCVSSLLREDYYGRVLAYLNALPGIDGFFFREYSPGGTAGQAHVRLYFSDLNARRIDAIRATISEWNDVGLIDEPETCALLADLMRAANRVANIAGTYGCYLKNWDARSRHNLELTPSPPSPGPVAHEVYCVDANTFALSHSFDALYLDPPYTWRHYGAYYHVLETIAWGDSPDVSGRTGLRPWKGSRSRYCDRAAAPAALKTLVTRADTEHLLLSYNDEGLITHDEIMSILELRGQPICIEVPYRRYLSNKGGSQRKVLKERLYYVHS